MSRRPVLALSLLLPVLVSGCFQVGPTYNRPEAEVETAWIEAENDLLRPDSPIESRWWSQVFHDQQLDKLVAMALDQNLSLRSAGLRVLQAQQQLAIAVGFQFPQQQQLTGSSSRQKESGVTFNNYSLGFDIGWEADLWGRFRYQVESAAAELDASVSAYDGVVVSLISQVARNYILLRTFQKRLQVARENIGLQTESLRISRAKFQAGEVSQLDVDQAESLLNNTRASVPAFETSLQQLKNSLATLLGTPPGSFNELLLASGPIPHAAPAIAVGMPQDLLRRRPDILQAERQLAAQSAKIGYAVTELYPHLSIGGSIGTSSTESSELFSNTAETWSLFGMFEWNIFNYGRLQSNVRLQDALFQQLLEDYRDRVLSAQRETEDAIVAYLKTHEQFTMYEAAAVASQRAVAVSSLQYQEGSITFNTLINTLQTNLQQQDLLETSKGSAAVNLVSVYTALGGGWEIRENRDPVDLLPVEMKETMQRRTKAWREVWKDLPAGDDSGR